MRRQLWNDGWSFRPKPNLLLELTGQSSPWLEVVVPHDAMVTEDRSPTEGSAATAFHRGGNTTGPARVFTVAAASWLGHSQNLQQRCTYLFARRAENPTKVPLRVWSRI